jgi:hypothetical protein
MAVPLCNGDGAMPSDTGERERIAERSHARQSGKVLRASCHCSPTVLSDFPAVCISLDIRHFFAYYGTLIGEDRAKNVIYLGACLIAAVRLAREEKLVCSPRVMNRIAESIQLARMIWARMLKE